MNSVITFSIRRFFFSRAASAIFRYSQFSIPDDVVRECHFISSCRAQDFFAVAYGTVNYRNE